MPTVTTRPRASSGLAHTLGVTTAAPGDTPLPSPPPLHPDVQARLDTERQMALAAARFAPGADRRPPAGPAYPPVPLLPVAPTSVLPDDLTPEERAVLEAEGVVQLPGAPNPGLLRPGEHIVPITADAPATYALLAWGRGGGVRLARMEGTRKAEAWVFADSTDVGQVLQVLAAFGIHTVDLREDD